MAVTEIICVESSLTDRYQTTVPDAVRKILGLSKRDKICYTIQSDGKPRFLTSEKKTLGLACFRKI
ncbi:type II toxin-antitoxin system PrlF family antitoxin [Scytonema hofmannii]|uniref:type II toxin-antitoxin system PrlF family antitoxin n=1 Tax=Scytonema hofmannii TaxID=34078 RepID=UPI0003493B60|nr:type II toxin-antitoxin system PrlF family antitoxin [Scytonema hofmannii]